MQILGLDFGSSSVKVGIVRRGKILGEMERGVYPTHFDGPKAEVDPHKLLAAAERAVAGLGKRARGVDAVALSVMAPAWVAMDGKGRALTPLITHQDRRSIAEARQLEAKIGQRRYLDIAGNRPFPGGISATTAAWFAKHEPKILHKADLIGHLNTFLHRQWTGERVIDPANASFTGLYETVKQGDWNAELCEAAGVKPAQLPRIVESNVLVGKLTTDAAGRLGLPAGMPVFTGMIDTSAAMLLAGTSPGQLLNVGGSTDVLALCTDKAHPHPDLLTRALGVGKRWMSVATVAAAGSALSWAHNQFFSEMKMPAFFKLAAHLCRPAADDANGVKFDPYLAGSRTSIEQKKAAFAGLTLATTREEMLTAIIDALAAASGARLALLRHDGVRMKRKVVCSGGAAKDMLRILHRDWPGKWTFTSEPEATLRGLSLLGAG